MNDIDTGAITEAGGVTDNTTMAMATDNAMDTATNTAMDNDVLPPPPLPNGWILKESRSQPDHYYYFHYDSGVTSWQPPPPETGAVNGGTVNGTNANAAAAAAVTAAVTPAQPNARESEASYLASVAGAAAAVVAAESASANKKRSSNAVTGGADASSSNKRPSIEAASNAAASAADSDADADSGSASSSPTKVRVLHILKKHRDSRRASSWRQVVCTATRDEAAAELSALLEILHSEEAGSPDQQATFEELARTESDCSSAKRGGDLGYFGRKKMQPAFESAAFGLRVGEMSGLIDTNSGVHVLLRIG